MLKSEQIKDKLASLEKACDAAEKDSDYWFDEHERAQDNLDAAVKRLEDIEQAISDLEDELEEAIREEEAGNPADIERYHAFKDKRQEDFEL